MPKKPKTKSKANDRSGFTLLFAVLIGSLLMAIGVAVAGIALRELALSSSARESEFAFYAADSGAECALYWDIQGGIFTTASPKIDCGGNSTTATSQSLDNGLNTVYSFNMEYGSGRDAACAIIKVWKFANGDTKIESNGVNDSCSGSANFRVQRSLRVEY